MPYIKDEDKRQFYSELQTLNPTNAGELNFVLSSICRDYFLRHGARYQQINDVIGAVEGAKLEFYRRLVAPYEDEKIKLNGDIY